MSRNSCVELAKLVAENLVHAARDRLHGVYLIGSLAHGGFSQRYSDVDVAVVFKRADPADEKIIESAKRVTHPEMQRLSIFWSTPDFAIGRFPVLDQIDFHDHRKPLFENAAVNTRRPSREEARRYLEGHPLEYWAEKTAYFTTLVALDERDHKELVRCALYPARLLYTWRTGGICSNEEAVAQLRRSVPAGLELGLIEQALICRASEASPEAIFARRSLLEKQRKATLEALKP